MANNQYVNKVIYDGTTLIDISDTTAVADKVLSGYTFYLKSGEKVTGTCAFDSNTQDGDATTSDILFGKVAYVQGEKIVGTMPNIGSQEETITTKTQVVTPSLGFHDGGGSVSIATVEQNKIIAENIRNGVTILGVLGTYTGSELVKATVGSATPSSAQQVILPSSLGDYQYFTQFTVEAIPYVETDNSAGGKTVTIG